MEEIWKNISGYPNYQISNMGRVKSLGNNKTRKEKILKGVENGRGYLQVVLNKEGKGKKYRIHRLVAAAFIPNPDNLPQVNHRNENKTDNRVENLEYCDSKYNINYGSRNERMAKAKSIPILQFSKTDDLLRKWDSAIEVKNELGFDNGYISNCCKGKLKSAYGYKWHYHYKSLWKRKHIPLKDKKVA